MTPTVGAEPCSTVNPWAPAAVTTSSQRAPAPTRTRRVAGSTVTLVSRSVRSSTESRRSPSVAAPWAVAHTATRSPCSVAARTVAATSAAVSGCTTAAGYCSTARL